MGRLRVDSDIHVVINPDEQSPPTGVGRELGLGPELALRGGNSYRYHSIKETLLTEWSCGGTGTGSFWEQSRFSKTPCRTRISGASSGHHEQHGVSGCIAVS